MALYIQKFGGTSVANVDCIRRVAERVIRTRAEGHDVVVVVSAMAGETDKLIALAAQMTETFCPREHDMLLTFRSIKPCKKGGRRPDMAQAGGTDATQLNEALTSVDGWVEECLS
jgi:aspartokinase